MKILKNTYSVGFAIIFMGALLPISAQSEEIPARGPIPFTAYDKDSNGLVSEEEFNTVRGERMSSRAVEGRPMRGAASAPLFSEFDTNGDGKLTQEELAEGQKAQMEKRRGMGMGMGQGRGMGQGMGRNMPAFSEYDLDGDGKILEKEFNEARSKRISERAQQGYQMRNLGKAPSFTDIDANGNGEISAEEFAAHQSQRRQQRAQ
ncbi:MAG: EF-hand domain-containing protein [Pseudomonadota bacterium]|jgi:Ca2+-binding EF-hand superfamily protein|nr:EF-hand domain-containing protein [Pseudomonadota bacterium]MDY6930209.1 EF-hand domain-containing protein [Pseudomonadota bacterium]